MKYSRLVPAAAFALVAWFATAQVSPTVVVSLAFDSTDDLLVLRNILDEAVPVANQAFQYGPLSGEVTRREAGSTYQYHGQFVFGPLGKPAERILFRYTNTFSPPILAPGFDSVRMKRTTEIVTIPDGNFVIANEDSYDFTLHVLTNLPTEIEALFDDGFSLERLVAYPTLSSAPSALSTGGQMMVLRFTNGLSVETLRISASVSVAGYGPLLVQN